MVICGGDGGICDGSAMPNRLLNDGGMAVGRADDRQMLSRNVMSWVLRLYASAHARTRAYRRPRSTLQFVAQPVPKSSCFACPSRPCGLEFLKNVFPRKNAGSSVSDCAVLHLESWYSSPSIRAFAT